MIIPVELFSTKDGPYQPDLASVREVLDASYRDNFFFEDDSDDTIAIKYKGHVYGNLPKRGEIERLLTNSLIIPVDSDDVNEFKNKDEDASILCLRHLLLLHRKSIAVAQVGKGNSLLVVRYPLFSNDIRPDGVLSEIELKG